MYDQSEKYSAEIAEMVFELRKKCFEAGIPFFVSCAVSDDGKHTEYVNDMISPADIDKKLSQDKIAEYVKMLNGFIAVPEQRPAEMEIDMDDIGIANMITDE